MSRGGGRDRERGGDRQQDRHSAGVGGVRKGRGKGKEQEEESRTVKE